MRAFIVWMLVMMTSALQAESTASSSVLELRQYKVFAGKRDQMIAVFDDKLIEIQEQVGMRLPGQFRDLDDPNRFTWVREFPSMEARGEALTTFYLGPLWKAHRGEANPLLEQTDNVLLLRPAASDLALTTPPSSARAKVGSEPTPAGLVVATIYYLWADPAEGFTKFFQTRLTPELAAAGLPVVGAYVPEPTPNNFPRLPVRQNEKVFVWFTRVANVSAYEKAQTNLRARLKSNGSLAAELADHQERQAQVLRLEPTSRSLLR